MDAARTDENHLSREQLDLLADQIAEQATHLDAATHRLLTNIRIFDEARGWARWGRRSCAEWLTVRLECDPGTAREHVRIARALARLPKIDDTLRHGRLSYAKVRAMTRIATPANDELLIEDALHCTSPQLERIVRKYAAVKRGIERTPDDDKERRRITKRDLDDGMVNINARLHPEEAELLWAALTKIARERGAKDFSRVDALIEIAQQVARGTSPDRAPTDIVLTVPSDALAAESTDDAVAGTTASGSCLSKQTVFRLACDAGLVVMLENEAGNCLSVGRKTRTIPASIKRALIKRDQTCRFPGCCNRVFLDGHHATHWMQGGETSLENLVTLCGFHHRFVHEYGYRVEIDEHQHPHFFDKEGRAVPEVMPRPEASDACAVIERANAPLAITPMTAYPRWDGYPLNYGWIIEDLWRADRRGDVSMETCADREEASAEA